MRKYLLALSAIAVVGSVFFSSPIITSAVQVKPVGAKEAVITQSLLSGTFVEVFGEGDARLPAALTAEYLSDQAVSVVSSKRLEEYRQAEAVRARIEAERLNKEAAARILLEKQRTDILKTAKSLLGRKYVWATQGPKTFDCSGYTQYVFGKSGIDISRTSYTQVEHGKEVSLAELEPSDLLFFTEPDKDRISHVGIYVGDGKFIHAAFGAGRVVVSELSGYYIKCYTTARRLF